MSQVKKTPKELLKMAEEDDLCDTKDSDSRLAFLFTIGIFEEGPNIVKVTKWLEKSDYSLDSDYKTKLKKFMANLRKSKTVVKGKIMVCDDPPSTMDLLVTMLAARGFIERCEVK